MGEQSKTRRSAALAIAALALVVLAAAFAFWRFAGDRLPGPGSDTYRDMVSAYYTGVAAMDADTTERAEANLTRATELVPGEPAPWADRGLLRIRLGNYEGAAADLGRARDLVPDNAEVERLLGLLESQQGRFEEAIGHLRRATALEPKDLKTRFALVDALQRQAGEDSDAECWRQVEEILKVQPRNLAVLIERARLAVKRGDAQEVSETVSRLGADSSSWPANVKEQYRQLEDAARQGDLRQMSTRVAFFRNVLLPTATFRQDLHAVNPPLGTIGEPIARFLRLQQPVPTFAPPDDALSHAVEPIPEAGETPRTALVVTSLTREGGPVGLLGDGREVRRTDDPGAAIPFPGGPEAVPPSPWGILPWTLDADAQIDLALAGAGGLKLFRHEKEGGFSDVTAASGLAADVLDSDYFGCWALDIDLDGDLDLVVGPREGVLAVLQNNGDGTFTPLRPFEGAINTRDFVAVDLDQDGDPDVATLDSDGALRIYSNERSGLFRPRPSPDDLGALVTLTIADLDGDGIMDIMALGRDGSIVRISDVDEGRSWKVVEVVRRSGPTAVDGRLFVADLDNNGGLDLVVSDGKGSQAWLNEPAGRFRPLTLLEGLRITAVADLNDDGLLDLGGLAANGRPSRAIATGTKGYHWQVLRPRAAQATGDSRINPFGIGGHAALRAGLLVQHQAIASPIVHFGLGDGAPSTVARIVWPNGVVQAEFDLEADQVIVAEQRLMGSCPFLFASAGGKVQFVADFLCRSPLGLRVNGRDTMGMLQTEDWVKVRGDQLTPVDGHYDLRITADLWETHYLDHMALLVVDHPEGTEVFVDERFSLGHQPPLAVHPTGPTRPVARAIDDTGRDVTAIVRDRDGRYLDSFGRGPYQGITRDHWVEIEIGDDLPDDRPLWLIAHGWTYPSDSSTYVAISQGRHDEPQDLVLEVPDRDGGWKVAVADLGCPSGKNKTVLVPLQGVRRGDGPRRCRLRTNLEIYWDSLTIAESRPDLPLKTVRLTPAIAEFRHRGFSAMSRADASSPELPDYNHWIGAGQRWRDLTGFYTRYGDVRELLSRVDDRYVIANAGDELLLRFPAPPPPGSGWARDFVMIGDGWTKEGDYNTGYSQTVLPLPAHDLSRYDAPPGALEDDPVYRRHPSDWREYHTRYVTPRDFQRGLRSWRSLESNHE